MEFVGEYLKKSRLNKKIDLKTVAKELNIQSDFLKKIENDDFSGYLDTIYLIGHIRAYAKFLGLNDNQVVKQFKTQNFVNKIDLTDEIPKPLKRDNFNFYFATKTFSIFSIIFITIGFYFLFIRTNDMYPNYSILPNLSESLESEIEEIEIQSTLKNINNISSVDIEKEVQTSILREVPINNNSFVSQGSVIASIPNKELNESNDIITLKFLESTWIQFRNPKNLIVFSKLMNTNDEYSYSIVDNFTLTAGNAGNILVLINGKTRGKVGKKGEIVDSLVINSDFNN